MYASSLDDETDTLQALWPEDRVVWKFKEMFAPIHWCYLYVDAENQGFFWVFRLTDKCTECHWSIREGGPYIEMKQANGTYWKAAKLNMSES